MLSPSQKNRSGSARSHRVEDPLLAIDLRSARRSRTRRGTARGPRARSAPRTAHAGSGRPSRRPARGTSSASPASRPGNSSARCSRLRHARRRAGVRLVSQKSRARRVLDRHRVRPARRAQTRMDVGGDARRSSVPASGAGSRAPPPARHAPRAAGSASAACSTRRRSRSAYGATPGAGHAKCWRAAPHRFAGPSVA